MIDLDLQIRLAVFRWLEFSSKVYGEYFPREVLIKGIEFNGKRVPLLGPPGIFKPAILPDIPLSITTAPSGPYDDQIDDGNFIAYRYRGNDPQHADNVGLRRAMWEKRPLVYFYGISPGKYIAAWPVYVVHDDPGNLSFSVVADDPIFSQKPIEAQVQEVPDLRRAYITTLVRQRLHQHNFRQRVLDAYHEQCAFCRLKHPELLDAAHIIQDSHPKGIPIVANGLALCKLHHAAFDNNFLAVRPEYTIEVSKDILDEEDGPMLLHGLKELHERNILLPTKKEFFPDRTLLELRYEDFRRAV